MTLRLVRAPITAAEAARHLGVSRKTVWRWAQIGRLPVASRTPGGHARLDRDDVERLAAELAASDEAAR